VNYGLTVGAQIKVLRHSVQKTRDRVWRDIDIIVPLNQQALAVNVGCNVLHGAAIGCNTEFTLGSQIANLWPKKQQGAGPVNSFVLKLNRRADWE